MRNLLEQSKVLYMPGARAYFDNRTRSQGERMYTRQVSDLLFEKRGLSSKRKAPNTETKESHKKLIVKNNNSEFTTQNYYYDDDPDTLDRRSCRVYTRGNHMPLWHYDLLGGSPALGHPDKHVARQIRFNPDAILPIRSSNSLGEVRLRQRQSHLGRALRRQRSMALYVCRGMECGGPELSRTRSRTRQGDSTESRGFHNMGVRNADDGR